MADADSQNKRQDRDWKLPWHCHSNRRPDQLVSRKLYALLGPEINSRQHGFLPNQSFLYKSVPAREFDLKKSSRCQLARPNLRLSTPSIMRSWPRNLLAMQFRLNRTLVEFIYGRNYQLKVDGEMTQGSNCEPPPSTMSRRFWQTQNSSCVLQNVLWRSLGSHRIEGIEAATTSHIKSYSRIEKAPQTT